MKKKIYLAIIFVCIITLFTYIYNYYDKNVYNDISCNEFDKIKNEYNVYIIFYSENCISCRKFKNDMVELKKDGYNVEDCNLYGLNIDKYDVEEIMNQYNINGVPILLKFSKNKVLDTLYKDISKTEIISFLELKCE